MDRRHSITVLALLSVLLVLLVARPLRIEPHVVTTTVTVPRAERTVETSTLPLGVTRVVQEGYEGTAQQLTYYGEWLLLGRRLSYRPARPDGRPTRRIVIEPLERIIEVGGRRGDVVPVQANRQAGVVVGVVGRNGRLLVEASGRIRFRESGDAGPEGDATYKWAAAPIRPDLPVGSLLFRVGSSGPLLAWRDLSVAGGGYRVIKGAAGASVTALVNDHQGMYGDNRGFFSVLVRYD